MDSTGKRKRRVRAIFYTLGIAGACYTATVALSVLGVKISTHLPDLGGSHMLGANRSGAITQTSEPEPTEPTRSAAGDTSGDDAGRPRDDSQLSQPLAAPQQGDPAPGVLPKQIATPEPIPSNTPTPNPTPEKTEPLLDPSTPQVTPNPPQTPTPVTPPSARDAGVTPNTAAVPSPVAGNG